MQPLGRALMVLGLVLLLAGALLYFGPAMPWLGRLPGDVRIERPGVRIYIPITTCLLLSAIVSAVLYVWSRLR
jgi:hypothetical protein